MTSLSRDLVGTRVAARRTATRRDLDRRTPGTMTSASVEAAPRGSKRRPRKGTHSLRHGHARARGEQSHYLELMLNALCRRPAVRRSSWAPDARLLRAWRPWSSSLGELLLDSVPWRWTTPPQRHEENVWCVGRDFSPYVCDVPFSCQSTCPSHQSHSRDPRSARALRTEECLDNWARNQPGWLAAGEPVTLKL